MAQQDQHNTTESRMIKKGAPDQVVEDHATAACAEGTRAQGDCPGDMASAGVDSSDLTTGRGQAWPTGQAGAAGDNPGSAGRADNG